MSKVNFIIIELPKLFPRYRIDTNKQVGSLWFYRRWVCPLKFQLFEKQEDNPQVRLPIGRQGSLP